MPSFSASRVVRSARICFNRREARLIDDPAAAAIESAAHLPSTARPGRDGRMRTVLPSTTKRALTARCAPVREHRLDRFRDPLAGRRRRGSGRRRRGSGRSFASRSRRERADVLRSLNVSVTGSATSVVRLGDCRFRGGASSASGSTWVSAGESVRAPVRAACSSAATSVLGVDGVAGLRRDDREQPPRARPGRGGASAVRAESARGERSLRRRAARAPGRHASAGGLGSTSCRTRAEERVVAGLHQRSLRRRLVDPQCLAGPDVVGLARRRRPGSSARGRPRRASTPGSGFSQYTASRAATAATAATASAASTATAIRPDASHDLQSSRCGGFTLIFVRLRDLPSVDELRPDADDPLAVGAGARPCSSARARRSGPGRPRATCSARLRRRSRRRGGPRSAASSTPPA